MGKFVIYKDVSRQYRWRFVAANGKIIADSAEGYWNKSDCKDGIELVKRGAQNAPIQDQAA